MVEVTVDAEKVEQIRADSSGRVNLGTHYAGSEVTIIVEKRDDDEGAGE